MGELNPAGWQKMMDEDIDWLEKQSLDKTSLEYRHILDCMKWLKDNKPSGKSRRESQADWTKKLENKIFVTGGGK